jgi:hypothetical protein
MDSFAAFTLFISGALGSVSPNIEERRQNNKTMFIKSINIWHIH